MVAALLGLALAVTAEAPAAAGAATAIERLAEQVTQQLPATCAPPRCALAVYLSAADSAELGRALQTALVARLQRGGYERVLPLRAESPELAEQQARKAGVDLLLRLTARFSGAELTVAGDAVPAWVNFWAGTDELRAAGGKAVAARALADAEATTLAHLPTDLVAGKPAVATRFELRPFARLDGRVTALAAADLDDDGRAELAALGTAGVALFSAAGQLLATREPGHLAPAARPPREPAGAIAVTRPQGQGAQVAAFDFGRARGELLALRDGALLPSAELEAPTVCSGASGALVASPLAGRNLVAAELTSQDGARRATLGFAPVTVAANPRPGLPAFLAVGAAGRALLLDAELRPLDTSLPALGAAVALGDLDGDGASDLVATLPVLSGDRVRLLRLAPPGGGPMFESEPVEGRFVAAAAADLDADGRDEAVLAFWEPDGTTSLHLLGGEP